MNEKTPREQRLDVIKAIRAEAARLLVAANHETVKNFTHLALRDLDDGAEMLRREKPEDESFVLSMVDNQIRLATWRLQMVTSALHTYGPNAKLFGE